MGICRGGNIISHHGKILVNFVNLIFINLFLRERESAFICRIYVKLRRSMWNNVSKVISDRNSVLIHVKTSIIITSLQR